ncbi:IMV heparin-binding surface protein [Hypsugopox virus]|nr:IMV heparin-binding surface protein [Hypsugopox virus]
MDMIKEENYNIPIIILPIVNRRAENVITDPAFHTTETGVLSVTVTKTENAGDIVKCFEKPKLMSATTNVNTSLYKFFEWEKVSKTSVEAFTKFFSPFCNSICTSEAKLSMANHFSLWEDLASTNNMKTVHHDEYVVVVENDNSMLNIPILYTLIESMKEHKIDILQLREAMYSGGSRDLLHSSDPVLYSYKGAYDINLSGYVIKIATMLKYIEEIKKIGGISTGLYFEMSKIEQDSNINRHILNDAKQYMKHETRYISNKRIGNMKNGLWNRVGNWLAKRFPDATYLLTMPLFSFFNIFDVTLLGVLIIIYILMLLIFDVHSKLLWFGAGAAFTYVI